MKSGDLYKEVRWFLKKYFGDLYKIVSVYIVKLLNWLVVRFNDGIGL